MLKKLKIYLIKYYKFNKIIKNNDKKFIKNLTTISA